MNSTNRLRSLIPGISPFWNFCDATEMRQRIFEMTQRLESEGDKLDAHEIEDLIVEEVRALGNATLSDWATSAEERAYQEAKAKGGVHLHEKKLHWQSTLGEIAIIERTLKSNAGAKLVRPFSEANAIGCRAYSRRLQRAMSDFGIERSFARAAARIREHYCIEVSVAAVRQATREHACLGTRFLAASETDAQRREAAIPASRVICEMDGSMLPVVEIEKNHTAQADPAAAWQLPDKHRRCTWKEVRLCAAVAQGSATPTCAVSFEGTAHAGMALASTRLVRRVWASTPRSRSR